MNQDQNDLNMQQDFDEFDHLVNDDFDILEEMDDADTSGNRRKRQTVFYLVLFFMLAVGGGAAWFLFFRPADTVTPLPMPGGMPPVAESMTAPPALDGLPPGVTTPEENAQSDLREASQQTDEPMAALPPALDGMMPPAAPSFDSPTADQGFDAPANDQGGLIELPPAAEISAPVDGTLAEALPPPSAPDNAQVPQMDPMEATDATTAPVMQQPAELAPVAPAEFAQDVQNPMAANANNATVNNAEVQQLQQRLGDMETHIQTLTQELQQVRSMNASAATLSSSMSDEQMKELTRKLDRLTQQVDALDQRTTTFAAELQKRADAPVAPIAAVDTAASAPKKVAKSKAKPAPKAAAKPAPRKNAVSGWELRSAQPGVAWLGRQGANEMGRYAVGQNVPGLGTVQDVTQEGGRWIVKTTGGTLRQ